MLNYEIKEFKGTDVKLVLELVSNDPHFLPDVQFLLPDDTFVDPADIVVDNQLTDPTDPKITYEVLGDFSDGIFQVQIEDSATPDKESYLLGNIANGIICLMLRVVNEQYDCVLFSQIEATKHFVLTNNRTMAIATYKKIGNKCVSCTGNIDLDVSHTDLCITSGAYKMV